MIEPLEKTSKNEPMITSHKEIVDKINELVEFANRVEAAWSINFGEVGQTPGISSSSDGASDNGR